MQRSAHQRFEPGLNHANSGSTVALTLAPAGLAFDAHQQLVTIARTLARGAAREAFAAAMSSENTTTNEKTR